ncbi:DNA methylase [Paenibacillus sp. yr247]|uniref:DNA methyltransferase n=1 Tax=Paenibacillus sp. yr247 TaxID=1761880 RepID=UPI00087DFB80|nr:DNA methyltransferase [Paenibacillus sp. yr247]SDO87119.1 DNA methylase [Paenibacillus sp. yr247]
MADKVEQLEFQSEDKATQAGPVTCLGMTFENEEARRAYFTEELRKKLPELRKIEGFPIGVEEDILTLSDPPYYTACPNPWISEIIAFWESEKPKFGEGVLYKREPFAADVTEGKNHPIYNAHSYHTKVPHKAIMKYILHYTDPGDIVFDGFCGTGMTAVAARQCGYLTTDEMEEINQSVPKAKLGIRKALISELSPAATFIAQGYNLKYDDLKLKNESDRIFEVVNHASSWMYKTKHSNGEPCDVNYYIWSDVFICPECSEELIFWDTAIDHQKGEAMDLFSCPYCKKKLMKKELERAWSVSTDMLPDRIDRLPKKVIVEINYSYGKKTFKKRPDEYDLKLLEEISHLQINHWFPTNNIPNGDKTNEPKGLGISSVDLFFTKRNLICASNIWDQCRENKERFIFTSLIMRLSKLSNLHISNYFNGGGGAASGNMKGMLHPPTISLEQNPLKFWPIRTNAIRKTLSSTSETVISTGSSTDLDNFPSNSVDYIFIDPPFGSNLSYSDLNVIWEGWLKVETSTSTEAIVNRTQQKGVSEYQELISKCLSEFYRILKPGRWITVEFSNTKASVWTSLQQAIEKAGFIVANVAVLDKKQGGYNANVHAVAVKKDLAISAYKPTSEMVDAIIQTQNTEESVWSFVEKHLAQLPVFIGSKDFAEIIVERTPRALFDRMVAYFVQQGILVPLSSAEFQSGVIQRFPMRDGMAFLVEQVAEYDKKRIIGREFTQLSLFVSDENSAIEWLRQQLLKKPQTRQELHPNFMKGIQHISKHEVLPELDVLLEQNFLKYDGDGDVPSQIHAYLSSDYKDLRNLPKNNLNLKEKAMDRWYVPDPNKQADLEKLREKSLLREFNQYVEDLSNNKKKLKQFRTEAIRVGFYKAWSEKDYNTIVSIGNRLPEAILQEDEKLLRYFDNAQTKLGL